MKPSVAAAAFTDTTATQSIKMGLDESATAHIMSLLTDVYSDREMAVIREYSTNAWDSHVEADVHFPIDITRPSHDDPTFVVQDYGVGLSLEDLQGIYSQYGASTKRDSNDATGMLGIGCKAALTYAIQFTIEAVKDDRLVICSVAKGEDRVGEMQVLLDTEAPADRPNGVTIKVPVSNIRTFNRKIDEFFWYWRDGEALIDGEYVDTIDDSEAWRKIDPDVYIQRGGHTSWIVQGGVAYPYDNDGEHSSVAFIPIGLVDFPPSREALQFTDRTQEIVDETQQFVVKTLLQAFYDDLAEVFTDFDRMKLYNKWERLLTPDLVRTYMPDDRRFKNFPKASTVQSAGGDPYSTWGWEVNKDRYDKLSRRKIKSFNRNWFIGGVDPDDDDPHGKHIRFIRNFSPKSFSDAHWHRIIHHSGMEPNKLRIYCLPPQYSDTVQTSSLPGWNWEDIPQLPKDKKPAAKKRRPTAYVAYQGNQTMLEVRDFPKPRNVVYDVVPNRTQAGEGWSTRDWVQKFPGTMLVLLTPRQEERFVRKFPLVRRKEDWLAEKREKAQAKLSPEFLAACEVSTGLHEMSMSITNALGGDLSVITNTHFLSLLGFRVDIGDEFPDEVKLVRKWGLKVPDNYQGQGDPDWEDAWEMLKEHYPLLGYFHTGWYHRLRTDWSFEETEHAVEYINANEPDLDEDELEDPDESDTVITNKGDSLS